MAARSSRQRKISDRLSRCDRRGGIGQGCRRNCKRMGKTPRASPRMAQPSSATSKTVWERLKAGGRASDQPTDGANVGATASGTASVDLTTMSRRGFLEKGTPAGLRLLAEIGRPERLRANVLHHPPVGTLGVRNDLNPIFRQVDHLVSIHCQFNVMCHRYWRIVIWIVFAHGHR